MMDKETPENANSKKASVVIVIAKKTLTQEPLEEIKR
jgi:hypothetical protein